VGEPPEDQDEGIRLVYRPFGVPFSLKVKKLWMRRDPERGEVVVFRFPHKNREDYIKRVIGLPGDTVSIQNGGLYINGKLQAAEVQGRYDGPLSAGCPEPTLFFEDLESRDRAVVHEVVHCRPANSYSDFGPITVPPDHFFAMGDNRDLSSDSRTWGFVPMENLKGKALFIHLPLDPDHNYLPRWKRFFKRIK
jgi:signal peptidase I